MRIAIVNDIVLAAEVLKRLVQSVPDYEVAWIAYDGKEAVQKCMADKPDLILMDLIMPQMDGTDATKVIMAKCPCAILIVTASVSGNISKVFEAMGHGALDVIAMPVYGRSIDSEGAQKLLNKMSMMRRLIGSESKEAAQSRARLKESSQVATPNALPIVVIGASTGGPLALASILNKLDPSFPAAIVVVQHVDGPFAENLVGWLQDQSKLTIKVAKESDTLCPGVVYVACTSDHMVLTKNLKMHYTAHPKDVVYRPSVDVFFESAAKHWPGKGVGVILTGMGRDGAVGLGQLKNAGWTTVAQDEESCVVYGMPKAAVEAKAVSTVQSLDAIAGYISQILKEHFVGVEGTL